MKDVDVLLVCNDGDAHGVRVLEELEALGKTAVRYNLSDVRSRGLVANATETRIEVDHEWCRITENTTVWWRRTGAVDTAGLASEEARLAADECVDVLRGLLAAARVRWVDHPADIESAELKLYQLRVAIDLGISTPAYTVTNHVPAANELAVGRSIVAKALSSGDGIAPFVDEVSTSDLSFVAELPVLLEELVGNARADLRVVVIAGKAFVWKRDRTSGVVDWRRADGAGAGFYPVEEPSIVDSAVRLNAALGLSMSVQDWLSTPDGAVFLEVNPQGGWLFLAGASEIVMPTLVEHLVGRLDEVEGGLWPTAIRRFAWDFLPVQKAPANDGARPPRFATPGWVGEASLSPDVINVARRAHDDARERAKSAEEKAGRLAQTGLALLTVTLAVAAYQAGFIFGRSPWWILTALPALAALTCLVIATFEAIQVDRVGFYSMPSAEVLGELHGANSIAVVLAEEDRGRRLADWTSREKHTDLMQARAWFTRGLAALIVAGLVAVGCKALHTPSPVIEPGSRTPGTEAHKAILDLF